MPQNQWGVVNVGAKVFLSRNPEKSVPLHQEGPSYLPSGSVTFETQSGL